MPAERRLRPAFAIVGAVAIAIAVVTVILLFGIRQPPSFPNVADERDERLAGRIAYVQEEDSRSCVVVVDLPQMDRHEVVCGDESDWYGQDVWWSRDGDLEVVLYEQDGPFIATFDPVTGAELDRRVQTVDDGPVYEDVWTTIRPRDGAELTWYSDDGSVEVQLTVGERERTLLSARGPRDYSLWDVSWSPDGGWAMVSDSEGRLLVVAATSPLATLLVADDAHSAAWGR